MLNGIEAMHDTGGVLTVKAQSENGQIKISVNDTDPGCRRARLAESSTRSLPPSRKAAAWAWPSANPSSNRMAAASGPTATVATASH